MDELQPGDDRPCREEFVTEFRGVVERVAVTVDKCCPQCGGSSRMAQVHECDERGSAGIKPERAYGSSLPINDDAGPAGVEIVAAAWVAVRENDPIGGLDSFDRRGDLGTQRDLDEPVYCGQALLRRFDIRAPSASRRSLRNLDEWEPADLVLGVALNQACAKTGGSCTGNIVLGVVAEGTRARWARRLARSLTRGTLVDRVWRIRSAPKYPRSRCSGRARSRPTCRAAAHGYLSSALRSQLAGTGALRVAQQRQGTGAMQPGSGPGTGRRVRRVRSPPGER